MPKKASPSFRNLYRLFFNYRIWILTCDTILHSVQTKAKNTKYAFKTLERSVG